MTDSPEIEIYVNGEPHRIIIPATVTDLLISLALSSERVAIELNREILPRRVWQETRLSDGDRMEIVQFVGGG